MIFKSDPWVLPVTMKEGSKNPVTHMTITAKYENGVFKPLEDVKVKEGTVVEVHLPSEQEPAKVRPSIKDLPFYGMWADRTDIEDGLSYVDNLRDNPRG